MLVRANVLLGAFSKLRKATVSSVMRAFWFVRPSVLVEQLKIFSIMCFRYVMKVASTFNPLNAKLNTIRPLLALFGAHHILHVSR